LLMNIPVSIYRIVVLVLPLMLSAGISEDSEIILRQVFPDADRFIFLSEDLQSEARHEAERISGQAFMLDKLHSWQIIQADSLIGLAVLDNARGKVQPITYLVILDGDLQVIAVRVIRYREQHGGAVQNLKWLEQFKGVDVDIPLKLGDQIDGITGATLSSTAMTKGVRRLLVYLSHPENQSQARREP